MVAIALVIAQAATCGLYGTTESPGGCSLPSPDGGRYLLQDVNGRLWIQERRPPLQINPQPSLELPPIQRH